MTVNPALARAARAALGNTGGNGFCPVGKSHLETSLSHGAAVPADHGGGSQGGACGAWGVFPNRLHSLVEVTSTR